MTTKCTWLFNGAIDSPARYYGFSETWYSNLTGDLLLAAMDRVSAVRRQCLAQFSSIIGYRVGEIGKRSFTVRRDFAAPAGNFGANVQVDSALMQSGMAGSDALKRFYLHNIPDDWVTDGQITAANRRKLTNVLAELSNTNFLIKHRSENSPTKEIVSVTAEGIVTTNGALGVAVGDEIQFLRCRDTDGRPIRGTYLVSGGIAGNAFTVAHWQNVVVARSGKARKLVYEYQQALIFGEPYLRVGGKKVGRPFFQLRGRAPNRR